eukprot:1180254-Prorocentrum_minimum.AAC.2
MSHIFRYVEEAEHRRLEKKSEGRTSHFEKRVQRVSTSSSSNTPSSAFFFVHHIKSAPDGSSTIRLHAERTVLAKRCQKISHKLRFKLRLRAASEMVLGRVNNVTLRSLRLHRHADVQRSLGHFVAHEVHPGGWSQL